ncbi:glycosyltransferase family 2 protein [Pectinatus haikarae]|uniref:glycosyltransferase family 2 protein n=1 Tax=Pectinatus haikarae TaxID=349096 RepID=UPI0018C4679A
MKKVISVVAPMYNEEKLVQEYCKTTLNTLAAISNIYNVELLLVNDGSKDKTYEKMLLMQQKYMDKISIINLSRNFGLEGAVSAGLKKAKGDAVVVMDADLQDPPALILEMVKKWENGMDIVVASRIKRSNDTLFKKLSAGCYYKVLNFLSGKLKLEKSAANFRLLSRRAVQQILELPEVNRVFRVIVPFIGMKTAVVEYDRDKRFAGKTKYKFASMLRYALDSITSISIEPLRKIVFMAMISFVITIITLLGVLFTQYPWNIACFIVTIVSFLFTLLFMVLTIIGEYIGQIMIEVKKRPTSIINEYLPWQHENSLERKNDK